MGFWETWQSYELADFLMFSPSIYFRMIENYVAWSWPLAALYMVGVLGAFVARKKTGDGKPVTVAIAMGWALPAYMFFVVRYANIMSAAPGFAALFVVQVGLLLYAVYRPPSPAAARSPLSLALGWTLVGVAFFYPFVAVLAGRGWGPLEPLGLMPDPVVALTVGWFVLSGERRVILWGVPALWAIISSLTLHTVGTPDYWVLPLLVGLSGVVMAFPEQGKPET